METEVLELIATRVAGKSDTWVLVGEETECSSLTEVLEAYLLVIHVGRHEAHLVLGHCFELLLLGAQRASAASRGLWMKCDRGVFENNLVVCVDQVEVEHGLPNGPACVAQYVPKV